MRRKILGFAQKNAAWVILLVLVVVFSIMVPQFRTTNNLIIILKQVAVSGIMAIGVAFVLIAGEIDLSTSAQIALSGMVCSLLVVKVGMPIVPACLITILVTMLIGLLNGTTVCYLHMPAMITTLGAMNIGNGIAYLVNGGKTVYGLPASATFIGQASVGRIPVSAIVMILAMLVGAFVLNKTRFGRLCFAVGSNAEAARLSGINVNLIKISVFLLCSAFVSIGGITLMARLNSGVPTAGSDLFLDVVIACVVGGVSSAGGEGRIFGLLGGVLVMGVLANGMSVMGLADYIQNICKGAVLIIAVGLDSYRRFAAAEKKAHVIRSSGEVKTEKK